MNCRYADRCGACDKIDLKYDTQVSEKKETFLDKFSDLEVVLPEEIGFTQFPEGRTRDRADLSFRFEESEFKFGFFTKDRSEILDIESCPQMSEELESWFQEFRAELPQVEKMSVRLRIGASGEKGVWLDLANIDIKKLLDEETWLRNLMNKTSFIEIGQRRKRLIEKEGKLKLGEAKAENWFKTRLANGEWHNLKMNVGSFSQPGYKTNAKMSEIICSFLGKGEGRKALELCSGSGNLSFLLASLGFNCISTELDKTCMINAEISRESFEFKDSLQFKRLNAHKKSDELNQLLKNAGLLVVDPPRSGLRSGLEVFEDLNKSEMPECLLYISCFLESLAEDSKKIQEMGYKISKVNLLDQFPHSSHCEYILLFQKAI
ncbi:MAG: hypothetical protein VX642_15765 [Bdellovibrionota bacterium]|nr:hypothetical protein [Bdellovibrionota bacterium]